MKTRLLTILFTVTTLLLNSCSSDDDSIKVIDINRLFAQWHLSHSNYNNVAQTDHPIDINDDGEYNNDLTVEIPCFEIFLTLREDFTFWVQYIYDDLDPNSVNCYASEYNGVWSFSDNYLVLDYQKIFDPIQWEMVSTSRVDDSFEVISTPPSPNILEPLVLKKKYSNMGDSFIATLKFTRIQENNLNQ